MTFIPKDKSARQIQQQDICYGVVVSPGLVVTAAHCWQPEEDSDGTTKPLPQSVIFYDKHKCKIENYTPSPYGDDLALIKTCKYGTVANFSLDLSMGEEFFVLGGPGDLDWAYSHGYIMTQGFVNPSENDTWSRTWVGDCPSCYEGDSGAGLWNMSGDLLGIMVAGKYGDGESILFFPSFIVQKIWHL